MILGDFKNYLVAQRAGMSVELVPHVFGNTNNRPIGQRAWYAWARVGADVINTAGFRVQVAPDGMCGWKVRPFPTVYDWGQDPQGTFGFHVRRDYTPNALTQVAGTGATCLLVHRSAAEKVRAEAGDVWFNPVAFTDGRPVSEDLSFCYRLNRAGIPVFVHTGVPTSHHKQIWVGEDEYRLFEAAYRAAAEPEPVVAS
ncbi:hypothetical protein GCM10022224_031880 [Nonomuraea antimicrobica]|uniref:Uncharacterized protein n=1 Tax=Nonomuraea antimicrobica TaxID=561173 RepID=A0ABP7BPG5_9ACTN